MSKPFRWNIARREQLGRLVSERSAALSNSRMLELRQACARIVAFAADADLVFIGRSPENFFDYLSGVLAGTSWCDRSSMVNISLRVGRLGESLEEAFPEAIAHGRALLAEYGLTPDRLLHAEHAVAFIDLVDKGTTFGRLSAMLMDWAADQRLDPKALRGKIRFIGVTKRTKTSPKTWRWQQRVGWTVQYRPRQIRNVSIPDRLWTNLGDLESKVTESNPPWRWGSPVVPERSPAQLEALGRALRLYDTGNTTTERRTFANALAREPGMHQRWYRALISELRMVQGRAL